LRRELEKEYDEAGGEGMLRKLGEIDPGSAARLHPNDQKRVVRAMEVYLTTGKGLSRHDIETRKQPLRYHAVKYALNYTDRAALYRRIEQRVDKMMLAGLEGEVRSLLEMGVSADKTSMQAIGYKEIAGAIGGGRSIDDAIEMIKMESRRYAKRQLTWLRRDPGAKWIVWDGGPDAGRGVEMIMNDLNDGQERE
jgi:tRNA dimethylallyltransferase